MKIEMQEDGGFVLRDVTLTFSSLWRQEEYEGKLRYYATLATEDREGMVELVRAVYTAATEAGIKLNKVDVVAKPGDRSPRTFLRKSKNSDKEYIIVLRNQKTQPTVLDKDCNELDELAGRSITWHAKVNALGSIFPITDRGGYVYGTLHGIQIVEPGTGGAGAMSAKDVAASFGGLFKPAARQATQPSQAAQAASGDGFVDEFEQMMQDNSGRAPQDDQPDRRELPQAEDEVAGIAF